VLRLGIRYGDGMRSVHYRSGSASSNLRESSPACGGICEAARFGRAGGGTGLTVDPTSIWRWVQAYGPGIYGYLHGEVKQKSSTWHMGDTSVWITGKWMYLLRAVDGQGQTVDF
jgi:hypothetical protein